MYTILMLNQKGGVGKTTIADELSFALERRGKTVAFVTTDPQGGSVHEVCDDPDFAEECDFQVVDTAGVLVGGVNDWCRAANLILVPMLPSTRDMEPTLRTLDIVRESGTGAKAYVIVNNFYAYGTLDRQLVEALCSTQSSREVRRAYVHGCDGRGGCEAHFGHIASAKCSGHRCEQGGSHHATVPDSEKQACRRTRHSAT